MKPAHWLWGVVLDLLKTFGAVMILPTVVWVMLVFNRPRLEGCPPLTHLDDTLDTVAILVGRMADYQRAVKAAQDTAAVLRHQNRILMRALR